MNVAGTDFELWGPLGGEATRCLPLYGDGTGEGKGGAVGPQLAIRNIMT